MKKFIATQHLQNKDSAELIHYTEQLAKKLGADFTPDIKKQFLDDAVTYQQQNLDLFDFAQTFLEIQKRRKELQQIPSSYANTKLILNAHLEDRIIAKEAAFKQKSIKTVGTSTGYIAVKELDAKSHPFMIKTTAKSQNAAPIDKNQNLDRMCFVNEFITAPLYIRTLYDRAPIIEGIESTAPDKVCLRSKFLRNFQTVAQFTHAKLSHAIGAGFNNLAQVKGAEKIFAAMLAWGEFDIHAGNIGVMLTPSDSGTHQLAFAKIDHGWSASQFFTKPSTALENFANAYQKYGYYKRLQLNIHKLKEALDDITSISDEEIEKLITSRIHKLKQMGFDLQDLDFHFWVDDTLHEYNDSSPAQCKSFSNFDELAKHYIDHYKQQMITMRKLSNRLTIIAKIKCIGISSDMWANGIWLIALRGQDPIAWAKTYQATIDDLSPEEWLQQQDSTRVTNLLYTYGFKKNNIKDPQQILSTNNIKAIRAWYQDILPTVQSSMVRDKMRSLNNNLNNFENAQQIVTSSRREELALKVISILKYFIADELAPSDIKKQVLTYEQKLHSTNLTKDSITEKENIRPTM